MKTIELTQNEMKLLNWLTAAKMSAFPFWKAVALRYQVELETEHSVAQLHPRGKGKYAVQYIPKKCVSRPDTNFL